MTGCACTCHGSKPCGMCCAEVVKKVLVPGDGKDRSKELLEKFFKGKK